LARSHYTCAFLAVLFSVQMTSLEAATIYVAAGGDLQTALNSARPGDTILLEEGAEFVGSFVLPAKTGDQWITLRTAAPDTVLPPTGMRIKPSQAPLLARLRSSTADAALRTAAGAHHWRIAYLEFGASYQGNGDIVQIGDGSSAQNSLDRVPHDIVLSHLYIHGDPVWGQKRGIALNAAAVTIRDSHISDCKGVGQDTQAIGGWNGPGPYTIENNYLEAAGENVMFGGADPAIPNLVADGITFRGNLVSRPMAWRDPILRTPVITMASREAGGSLPDGTYAYRVVADGLARGTATPVVATRSTASAESVVTASGGASAIRIRWQAVSGATGYRVFGRASGGQTLSWAVTTTEFLDTGAAGTTGAVPTAPGTVWNVKNIFELKSARNVLVENNILENHWKEGQPGSAIVLTPRNSNGACTWCVVENVRFQYNIVRNIAAGINLLGYDSRPTRQTNNISFVHNVFTKMNTSLGGNARFLQIDAGPRDVNIEHNTIDSNGTSVVYVVGGTATDPTEVYGFRMFANAARHGSYGIFGANFGYGNDIITHYFPDGVIEANCLAGAPASRYPPPMLISVQFCFDDQFVNTAEEDYTLRPGSILRGAAPDRSDIGANYPEVWERVRCVRTGSCASRPNDPPTASFAHSCVDLTCQFTDTSSDADGQIVARSWTFGSSGSSTLASPTFTFAAPGTNNVILTVTDDDGATATASVPVEVTVALHAALLASSTKKWTSASGATSYWSAAVTVAAHGSNEQPIAGATITVNWTGGVTKTATCITAANGQCTFQSGTLSYLRSWVTLTVTNVSVPLTTYSGAANHTSSSSGAAVTMIRP
jgi:PKD repeat protein